MSITADNHHVHLLIRELQDSPLWSWDTWASIASSLEPLVAAARADATVASHQNSKSRKKPVKFPVLTWSDDSHSGWTHGSPRSADASGDWLFASTHVFAPAWAECVREDLSPDLYIELKQRKVGRVAAELLLISISERLTDALPTVVECMQTLHAKSERPRFLACQTRPFTYSVGGGMSRGVDELTHLELEINGSDWSLDAFNDASRKVDRRTRVEGGRWSELGASVQDQ